MFQDASLSFKIATYNLEVTRRPEKLISNIVEMAKNGVDIFCLQEVIPSGQDDDFILHKLLKKLGDGWEAEWSLEDAAKPFAFGNAIVWNKLRFKKISINILLLPQRRHPLWHEKIFSRMVGFSGKSVSRRGLVIDFIFYRQKIRVCSVHADVLGGASHRREQVRVLLENLSHLPIVEQTIIAGDFNTINIVAKDKERRRLQQIFAEYGFMDSTNDIAWSHDIYQANLAKDNLLLGKFIKGLNLHFRQKLDYIWAKNLHALHAHSVKATGSDHLPLVAQFELKKLAQKA